MAETGASPLPAIPPPASRRTPDPRSPLARAEQFLWLTARVLERRLFAYHFRGGDPDPVETALDAYRNEDGGYGHALEPDVRGPASQPLHTARALRVLDAVGRCGGQRIERVCRYLTSVSTPDGALPLIRAAGEARPAAPFVPVVADPPGELLATGPVVGLLHRNEVWHAWLFRATDFCWQAAESLEASRPYEIEAAVAFLDTAPDRSRAQAAADRLGRLVRERRLAVLDPDGPGGSPVSPGRTPGEHRFPHDYARDPRSLARAWFTDDEMARSLDFLAAEQEGDGGWPVRRPRWAPAPATEARTRATIEALRTLRAYGRPLG
ncbi:hypothetical protein ACFWQ6_36015 [Streptomyces coelicoflavus]|uniref:hypothetical protein n=1 Tax=Streptomyces coelicoflavus TaxID=285562 RepID=UPI0036664674